MFCPKCGKELIEGAKFCTNCGTDVPKALGVLDEDEQSSKTVDTAKVESPPQRAAAGDVTPKGSPEKMPDDEKPVPEKSASGTLDLGDAIGKNREYYLIEFYRIEGGLKSKFNWAAFLFGPAFCFYRRCGELFKKYFLLSCILLLLGDLVETVGIRQFDPTIMLVGTLIVAVGGLLQLINQIRFGMQFNKVYYRHCKNMESSIAPRTGVSLKGAICYCIVCILAVFLIFGVSEVMGKMADTLDSEVQLTFAPTPTSANPEVTPMIPNENVPDHGTNDFPPTLPPVDPNDPNADILSDYYGLYINENGYCLELGVGTGDGINYYGAIYRNREDAENYVNRQPLAEFSMGRVDAFGNGLSFTFVDYAGNQLSLVRDGTISDYYTLLLSGDAYFDDADISPCNGTTFFMIQQGIDVDGGPMPNGGDTYSDYNLYVYEGTYYDANDSIMVSLTVVPNGTEFACELFWNYGGLLELGTVYPGVPTQLSEGTIITIDLEPNGNIHILLEGDDLLGDSYSLDMMKY